MVALNQVLTKSSLSLTPLNLASISLMLEPGGGGRGKSRNAVHHSE